MVKRTDEELLNIARQSYNVSDMLHRLGLSVTGGNHLHYKRRLAKLQFTEFAVRPLGTITSKSVKNITDRLIKGDKVGGSKLRASLIKHGILENKCVKCGIGPEWYGEILRLHLDHIDGDRYNNVLTNLRILCPNCHSQTETYGKLKTKRSTPLTVVQRERTKRSKLSVASIHSVDENLKCKTCQLPLLKRNKTGYCKDHYVRPNKVYRPSYEKLLEDVAELGYLATGRKYDVSDNMIRKWLRVMGKQRVVLNSGGPIMQVETVEGDNAIVSWKDDEGIGQRAMLSTACLSEVIRLSGV